MDDFVKKAFADAAESAEKAEAKAFVSRIANNIETISMACGIAVGLDEMDKLSGAVLKAGVEDVFSEWTRHIMMIAFSEGFAAARIIGDISE